MSIVSSPQESRILSPCPTSRKRTVIVSSDGTSCAVVVDSEVCESDNHWKPRPSASPPNQMASTANKSTGISHHGSFC